MNPDPVLKGLGACLVRTNVSKKNSLWDNLPWVCFNRNKHSKCEISEDFFLQDTVNDSKL